MIKQRNFPTKKVSIAEAMPSQLAFTCSNSTIETLEKDVKYVQS